VGGAGAAKTAQRASLDSYTEQCDTLSNSLSQGL
jgi:hypothetical protein